MIKSKKGEEQRYDLKRSNGNVEKVESSKELDTEEEVVEAKC